MLLVIWQFIWAFCSTTWRKFSKIFLLQYKKLDDYEMYVVYYLRWIFTITKWYGKSPCKETIIAPTMLNLNGWKIYHYFLLRRKRTAVSVSLCDCVKNLVQSLQSNSLILVTWSAVHWLYSTNDTLGLMEKKTSCLRNCSWMTQNLRRNFFWVVAMQHL